IGRTLAAWHYDGKRPVPAREVARVLGFLMSDFAETRALLEPADWSGMADHIRAKLAPPREITDGAAPGVEFWIIAASDQDLGPPLFRVQVTVAGGGSAHVRTQQITDLE